jgi:hypothetical protein
MLLLLLLHVVVGVENVLIFAPYKQRKDLEILLKKRKE